MIYFREYFEMGILRKWEISYVMYMNAIPCLQTYHLTQPPL